MSGPFIHVLRSEVRMRVRVLQVLPGCSLTCLIHSDHCTILVDVSTGETNGESHYENHHSFHVSWCQGYKLRLNSL